MKIFIGGMKRIHQIRFKKDFPEVEFIFAALEDAEDAWVRRARPADFILIDQSRCSHRIIDRIRTRTRAPVYFTDSKRQLHDIIKELQAYGTSRHSYVHPAGSESITAVPAPPHRPTSGYT